MAVLRLSVNLINSDLNVKPASEGAGGWGEGGKAWGGDLTFFKNLS